MKRVLVVDDDKSNCELMVQYLQDSGLSLQTANDAESALHRVRAWKPHIVLLDVEMPGQSGLELLPKIRAATPQEYIAVALVTANITPEDVQRGFDAGADDYLTKPFRPQDLVSSVKSMSKLKEVQDALRRAHLRVEELSSHDELTGLFNMRFAYRRGEEEIVRCRRFRKPVSALMVNVDQFADVNQTDGFIAGSKVLQEVALRLKQCVRSIDCIARVGADEFFILLSETDLSAAEFVGERVRDAIQATPFKTEKKKHSLTVCVGVATVAPDQSELRMPELLHHAAEALRSAKANGSNRLEIYSFA